MSSQESNKLLEEARLLLPWYLTNKLTKAEQSLVNQALESFPELRREFLQEEKMMRVVRDNTSLLELAALDTTEQRLAKMMARIGRDEAQSFNTEHASEVVALPVEEPVAFVAPVISEQPVKGLAPKKEAGWLDFLWKKKLFDLDWLTPANAVFASLLALQAGVMAISNEPVGQETVYKSAAAESLVQAEGNEVARFLMEFASDAPHQAVCDFLNHWSAHIVSGPDGQNFFTVEMMVSPHIDKAALADSIMQNAAKDRSPVRFVGPQYQDGG